MRATTVEKDPENMTLTVSAQLSAAPERAWQLWADPKQFERWWGAPGYPATTTAFDMRTGGKVEYHLTGPDGDTPNNVWEIVEADPPRLIVLRDAIVDDNDVPIDEGPSRFTVRFEPTADGGTKMSIESRFPNEKALQIALEMDMDKMFEWSFDQMEAVLSGASAPVEAA
jgi:uncharacterized protein YndB with AHSA1/START domain